ncbi:unnamed protein product [Bursaphelenchus xylophilus]|uniref:(pine wood nematode) hypothetical protein n=1 Tax=Bursaphelenchus xylophilus TaxID=6326 RepID=A0A1I7SCK4_BURXY|nr:unnamed protein product [Bursaphelenchus xylophilus]CAG9093946.1 unnamed protein product [Bursaphelenchus xylophilus]
MIRTKAVERYLEQATGNGVQGAILFDKDGRIVARAGSGSQDSILAVFTAKLWESFDRQGSRDRLREVELRNSNHILLASRVVSMIMAVVIEKDQPTAVAKAKLNRLVEDLREPMSIFC